MIQKLRVFSIDMKGREYRAQLGRGQCCVPDLRWNPIIPPAKVHPVMSDSQHPEPLEPKPRFRLNVQVFQIFGLVIIALALPFTILILGLLDIRKNTKPNTPEKIMETIQSSVEPPDLRSAFNSIAESLMPTPLLEDGIRRFLYVYKKTQSVTTETHLKRNLENVGAICLDASETRRQKYLAHIPIQQAEKFESDLDALQPSEKPSHPLNVNSQASVSYEITIQRD